MSREHMISESQFDDTMITIHGLPWCKEPKSVGLASLVARNLCRDHNTALSEADAEAARLKRALKTFFHQPRLPVRLKVDARLVERWLLKTTINLALQDSGSGLSVTPDLVRRAFGAEPTPRAQGFYFVAEEGEPLSYRNGLRFESMVRRDDSRMVIGGYMFHAWRLLYAFEGAPAVRGAMRPRYWHAGPHWFRFRWNPEFSPDDAAMGVTTGLDGDHFHQDHRGPGDHVLRSGPSIFATG